MFNLGQLGNFADILNNLDNAAKETLEEPKESATSLRQMKKKTFSSSVHSSAAALSEDDYINVGTVNEFAEIVGNDTSIEENTLVGVSSSSINIASSPIHSLSLGSKTIASAALAAGPIFSSQKETNDSLTDMQHLQPISLTATKSSKSSAPMTSSLPLLPNDAKQIIKSKNQEIERLNSEILELEESCSSLKHEVQDAWNSYKSSQEKAMFRENELQEEIRLLQRAKSTDKQQIQLQLTNMNDELANILSRLKATEAERDDLIEKFKSWENVKTAHELKEKELQTEIDELKLSALQGVQGLREENKKLTAINDELRQEKLNILRSHELKLFEYEKLNEENINLLRAKERDVASLKSQLSATGGLKDYQILTRDYDQLKTEYDSVISSYNSLKDIQLPNYEQKIRQLESELKMSYIRAEDELSRVDELLKLSDKKIIELQQDLSQATSSRQQSQQGSDSSSSSSNTSANTVLDSKVALMMEQIQSLSKQLLKKQEASMELQSEKSLLKSKIADLTARCNYAEQELARLRDLEDGDGAVDDDVTSTPLSSSGTNKLVHRNPVSYNVSTPVKSPLALDDYDYGDETKKYRGGGKVAAGQGKVVKELEQMGVRPSAGVASAVNFVDSLTLVTGKFLRTHPIVRIFFVFYLLMLHVWVFVVLIMHVHTIDVENTPPVVNNIVKRTVNS